MQKKGGKIMAVLSMFYGIIVSMFAYDNREHKLPHVHAKYQEDEAVITIPDGNVIKGKMKPEKLKLVQAWIEIHKDDLMANWDLAANGQKVYKIEPLR